MQMLSNISEKLKLKWNSTDNLAHIKQFQREEGWGEEKNEINIHFTFTQWFKLLQSCLYIDNALKIFIIPEC